MQNTKFYTALLVLVIFAGIFSLSPAISSLMNAVVMRSTGKISTGAYARSGSARDIQAAVDWVAGHGGIGNVYIPEGTFNFVEVGEPWMTVNIPAGVNLFGAPTERDANGQVVEWKTVLVMPYEVPTTGPDDQPTWFAVQFDDNYPDRSFRFSDIKLVGWRYFDYLQNGEPNWTIPYDPENPGDRGSETMYIGLSIYLSPYESDYITKGIQNFRVDHCHFQDLAGSAIWVAPGDTQHNRRAISGVIDHNIIVNSYGDPGRLGTSDYQYRTLDYGIGMRRWACDVWDSNIDNVIGHYNNYTIFIENNYFSKWRHCICVNDGLHAVIRYNIFDGDYGVGSVDAHGSYAVETSEYAVGTRAMEVYNNTFKNPAKGIWDSDAWAINVRGGSGIIFNNTLEGYDDLVWFNQEWGNVYYQPKCKINDTYIWDNNLGGGNLIGYNYGGEENSTYFLYQKPGYTPYPYPHPLTLEVTP